MNGIHNEIRTGILAIITLGVLVVVLIYLGAPEILRKMNHYQVYFDNAGGIEVGAPVMLGGRRVGQVSRIISPVPEAKRPRPNLETIVDVAVDANAQIYRNAHITMLQYGLLGEQVIDFTGGSESAALATSDAEFIGERQPGLNDVAPKLLEKLDPLIASATKALDEIERTATQVTNLTADNSDLNKAIANFRELGNNLVELSGSNGSVQKTIANLEVITGTNGELAITLGNVRKVTDRLCNNNDIEKTLVSFRRATDRFDRTLQTIRPNLNATVHNAEQFTDTLKREPWRLIWPSTKKYPGDEGTPSMVAERKRKPAMERRMVPCGKD